jgi:hypothetical protein
VGVLVLLALLLLAADRTAAWYVERRIAAAVAQGGGEGVAAEVTGYPFLIQALNRELDEVVVTADAVERAGTGRLEDVRLTGTDVRLDDLAVPVAGELAVDAVVPFAQVAAALGAEVEIVAGQAGSAIVRRPAEVLGQQVEVSADVEVGVEEGRIAVRPLGVTVDTPGTAGDLLGAELLARDEALRERLFDLVRVDYALPELPGGLLLEQVSVGDGGFEVRLTGTDVPLQVRTGTPLR